MYEYICVCMGIHQLRCLGDQSSDKHDKFARENFFEGILGAKKLTPQNPIGGGGGGGEGVKKVGAPRIVWVGQLEKG